MECAERLRDQPTQCPGFYKDQLARTAHLEAHAACQFIENEVDNTVQLPDEFNNLNYADLPPKFDVFTVFDTPGSSIHNEPKMLDEAFNGAKANEW